MDRRLLWICLAVGSTVGGLLPETWGGSAFGLASLLLSALGAAAGVWVAARLSESLG
jgi:uncharacterized membrane protein YeaQ/YmgE (transglycosylase-associated protein family)